MEGLVRTVWQAANLLRERQLRAHEGLGAIELARNYPIAKWCNDQQVDRDLKRVYLNYVTRPPLLTGAEYSTSLLQQAKHCGATAYGLHAAHLLRELAVSLPSDACWDTPLIGFELESLDDDNGLTTETVTIPHASRVDHVSCHVAWAFERDIQGIDGKQLVRRWSMLLPHLVFCDRAEEHVSALSAGEPKLEQAIRRLREIDVAASHWQSGEFPAGNVPGKPSPESRATLNQFGRDREFLCTDGVRRVFTLHLKLTPEAWRIHILPDTVNRRVWIGYIGPHLPTASDPT